MAKQPPLTDPEKQRIRELWNQGKSRNAIAKEIGRGESTISRFCATEGLVFPSAQSNAFLRAREGNVRERSVAAHETQLRILEKWNARVEAGVDGQGWMTRVKGANGAEDFRRVDFVPADDFRNAQTAATSATSALKNLAPVGDAEKDAAVSVVEALAKALQMPPEVPE